MGTKKETGDDSISRTLRSIPSRRSSRPARPLSSAPRRRSRGGRPFQRKKFSALLVGKGDEMRTDRVWRAEEGLDGEEDGADLERGRPLVL